MHCIEIATFGPPEGMRLVERETPAPGSNEVLIEVSAAGVNRPDVVQRYGKYPPPPGASDVPGLEVAGRVSAVGAGVTRWRVGDLVCALVSGGGYATHCVAPEGQCLPIPWGPWGQVTIRESRDTSRARSVEPHHMWRSVVGGLTNRDLTPSLSLVDAAALPETTFTVWTNLFERGKLVSGETVLIHGGTSGIGTTAIQMAAARGATVFATAGSDEKVAACRALGAHEAWNYRTVDWADAAVTATSGRGVNVILDIVGGDYAARNLAALAVEGRLVQIAFLKTPAASIDLSLVMRKRLWITGSTLRPRSVAEKTAIARAVEDEVWPIVEAGRLRPVIHATFPLAEAAAAHRLMESSQHIGKIVLTTDGEATEPEPDRADAPAA